MNEDATPASTPREAARGAILKTMLALVVIGASPLAAAADRDWVHYNEFLKRTYLDRFYAAPATTRDALVAKVTIRADSPDKTMPIEIKVPTATGVVVLRPDEDGLADFPYSEALVQADPMLSSSLPAGMKVKASINPLPSIALKETYSVAEAARPVDQVNALIRSQAGLLAFAVPKVKRFLLKFPPGSGATVTVGETTLKPDKSGLVFVAVDDAFRKSGASIVCSQRPIGLDID